MLKALSLFKPAALAIDIELKLLTTQDADMNRLG
jgi:hypothetical protein